ncbi:MAG: hypothetical protein ABIJ81_03460 [Patescibacteria group bacterium]
MQPHKPTPISEMITPTPAGIVITRAILPDKKSEQEKSVMMRFIAAMRLNHNRIIENLEQLPEKDNDFEGFEDGWKIKFELAEINLNKIKNKPRNSKAFVVQRYSNFLLQFNKADFDGLPSEVINKKIYKYNRSNAYKLILIVWSVDYLLWEGDEALASLRRDLSTKNPQPFDEIWFYNVMLLGEELKPLKII